MKIKVDGCFLSPERVIAGTMGSIGETRLDMYFGKDWDGFDKIIVFRTPLGKVVQSRCDQDGACIPEEVMRERGKSSFCVVGEQGGIKRRTLCGELYVLGTIDTGDDI